MLPNILIQLDYVPLVKYKYSEKLRYRQHLGSRIYTAHIATQCYGVFTIFGFCEKSLSSGWFRGILKFLVVDWRNHLFRGFDWWKRTF